MKKKTNYKEFIPIGVCFMGAGVVFLAAVNQGVGFGLIGVGLAYLAIGLKKSGSLRVNTKEKLNNIIFTKEHLIKF